MIEAAVIRKLGFRIKRKLKTLQAFIPEPQLDDIEWKRRIAGSSTGTETLSQLDELPPLTALAADPDLTTTIGSRFSDELNEIITLARQAMKHQFDLLGSGLKHLGQEIDWSLDFKSGKRWPLKDYRLQKIVDLQDNSDVKVPWELSRCNHFMSMAIAYLATDDTRLALEFENQVISWREQNRYQETVNWTCAMEAAIRCVNWLLSYQLFASRFDFAQNFKDILTIELFKGGLYIRKNLERTATGFNTNHYLSDLLGLLYLGVLFMDSEVGREWFEFAHAELEREMSSQVFPEGVDYESSLPYHGLVTEIFLLSQLLAGNCSFEFSRGFNAKLELMVSNLARFAGAGGQITCFGDADDGRVLRFTGRSPRDFRDLIVMGTSLLSEVSIDKRLDSLESMLIVGKPTVISDLTSFESIYLAGAGICQLRSEKLTANFFVNEVGTGGLGNHKHNDILSLTLDYEDHPLLIDPGTYVYTADERWRNQFRSTWAHSTVLVDWEEQNRMVNGLLFFLRTDANPKVVRWESNDETDLTIAEHDGYSRLEGEVVHRRSLCLIKQSEILLIRDELLGTALHDVQCLFQFANRRIEALNPAQILFHCEDVGSVILFADLSADPHLLVDTNWISPSYGVKEPGIRISSGGKYTLPITKYFAIAPLEGRSVAAVSWLALQHIKELKW